MKKRYCAKCAKFVSRDSDDFTIITRDSIVPIEGKDEWTVKKSRYYICGNCSFDFYAPLIYRHNTQKQFELFNS